MKKIIVTMIGLAFLMSGCASLNSAASNFNVCSAVDVVAAQQVAVEAAANVIVGLHQSKQLSDAVYTKAEMSYDTWAESQGAVVTALTIINDSGTQPTAAEIQQYGQLLVQLAVLSTDFLSIYNSISSTKATAMTRHVLTAASATPAVCSIMDASIKSELTVPQWQTFTPTPAFLGD